MPYLQISLSLLQYDSMNCSADVRLFQVFMVVARDKTIFRFSAQKAVFLFSPFNPIRRFAIYLLTHPYPCIVALRSITGRIHGAIVATTVGAIVASTIACSVYTRRLSRRSSPRRSPRQSPHVYTTGDRRGDEHLFNRATNWRLSP